MYLSAPDTIFPLLSVLFALIAPLITFVVCHHTRRQTFENLPKSAGTFKPEDMGPIELAMLANEGRFRPEFFWLEIVGMAVRKYILIEKSNRQVVWDSLYYERARLKLAIIDVFNLKTPVTADVYKKMDRLERRIMDIVFCDGPEVNLFGIRNYLSRRVFEVGDIARANLVKRGFLSEEAVYLRNLYYAAGIILLWIGILFVGLMPLWRISLAACGIIFFYFGSTVQGITPAGRKIQLRLELFKKRILNPTRRSGSKRSVMDFEKILPIAMALGIADEFLANNPDIGPKGYHPAWYSNFDYEPNFDAKKFLSGLNGNFKWSHLVLDSRSEFES